MFDLNQVSLIGKVIFAKHYENTWGGRMLVRIAIDNGQSIAAWVTPTDRKQLPTPEQMKDSVVALVGKLSSYQDKKSGEWKYNIDSTITKCCRVLHDVDQAGSTAVVAGDVVAVSTGSMVLDIPYWGKDGEKKVIKSRRVMIEIDPSVPCYAKERQKVFITGRIINHEKHGAVVFAQQIQVIK